MASSLGSSYESSSSPVTCLHTEKQRSHKQESALVEDVVERLSRLPCQEKDEIMDRKTTRTDISIHPKDRSKPHEKWADVMKSLNVYLTGNSGWIYITCSEIPTSAPESKKELCDILIFLPDKAVKILTLLENTKYHDEATRHNSLLAKVVIGTVQKNTSHMLSVVHGVLGKESWQKSVSFFQDIEKLELRCQSIAIPGTMDMDSRKYLDITHALLYSSAPPTDAPTTPGAEPSTGTREQWPSYEELKVQKEELQNELQRVKLDYKMLKWNQSIPQTALPYQRVMSDSDDTMSDGSKEQDLHAGGPGEFQLWGSFRSSLTCSLTITDKETGEDRSWISGDERSPSHPSEDLVKTFDYLISNDCNVAMPDSNGDTLMHLFCRSGNALMVEYLLRNGVFAVNCRGRDGRTPVMEAARYGHRKVFDILQKYGCNMALLDDYKDSVLNVACLSDNDEFVDHLLSLDVADINVQGKMKRTPVMNAARNGCKKVFEMLRCKGCSLSMVDTYKNCFLHIACLTDNEEFVYYLLPFSISYINIRGYQGRTPIMTAASRGCRHVFDMLRKNGGSVSDTDDNGNNVLHLGSRSGNAEFVNYLLTLGFTHINATGYQGRTPVMQAARKGSRSVFDLLRNGGCDLTLKDDNEDSILHVACRSGSVDFVRYLLSLGIIDINTKGKKGSTSLMQIATRGWKQLFELLLEHNADPSVVDDDKNTILHAACLSGRGHFVEHVLKLNTSDINTRGRFGRTPIMVAASIGCKEVFDVLEINGSDLALLDENNNSILNIACLVDNVGLVAHILSLKIADINVRGFRGNTPVMQAATRGCQRVFNFLVSKGCALSVVSGDGDTVLHAACIGGNVHIVEYLLQRGLSQINRRGQYGRTPVMISAIKGHGRVFDLLVNKGCSLSGCDDAGANILHLACAGGDVKTVEYILERNTVDINHRNNDGHTPAQVAQAFDRRQAYDLLVAQNFSMEAESNVVTRL